MINPERYEIEISRDNLLDDSLNKIVRLELVGHLDRLKLPIKIWFANEPGIDAGGLTKEYFNLVTNQLFNP